MKRQVKEHIDADKESKRICSFPVDISISSREKGSSLFRINFLPPPPRSGHALSSGICRCGSILTGSNYFMFFGKYKIGYSRYKQFIIFASTFHKRRRWDMDCYWITLGSKPYGNMWAYIFSKIPICHRGFVISLSPHIKSHMKNFLF